MISVLFAKIHIRFGQILADRITLVFRFQLVDDLCLQEEFLKDVMQFLILRGHTRLIPQGGLAEFPDAILNAKRLDLFNLYREVSFPFVSSS